MTTTDVFDGKWHRWSEFVPGPATTVRIKDLWGFLGEDEMHNSEYQYSQSPQGFGWNRRPAQS